MQLGRLPFHQVDSQVIESFGRGKRQAPVLRDGVTTQGACSGLPRRLLPPEPPYEAEFAEEMVTRGQHRCGGRDFAETDAALLTTECIHACSLQSERGIVSSIDCFLIRSTFPDQIALRTGPAGGIEGSRNSKKLLPTGTSHESQQSSLLIDGTVNQ